MYAKLQRTKKTERKEERNEGRRWGRNGLVHGVALHRCPYTKIRALLSHILAIISFNEPARAKSLPIASLTIGPSPVSLSTCRCPHTYTPVGTPGMANSHRVVQGLARPSQLHPHMEVRVTSNIMSQLCSCPLTRVQQEFCSGDQSHSRAPECAHTHTHIHS